MKCGLSDGSDVLGMDVSMLQAGLLSARKQLEVVRKNHLGLRIQHLSRLATSNPDFSSMMDRERIRSICKRLQDSIPSKEKRPLYMVQDIDGSWMDSPERIFCRLQSKM